MNFKDIDKNHIIEFLTINNKQIDLLYKTAIILINNGDYIPTKHIDTWLIAFNLKNNNLKPIKASDIFNKDLLYYKQLFEVKDINYDMIIDVFKYLHLYINDTDYFTTLPCDIMYEIIVNLNIKDIHSLKQVSSHINYSYKNILKNNFYMTNIYINLLKDNYTNINHVSINRLKEMINVIYPLNGEVLYVSNLTIEKVKLYDDIVKIYRVTDRTIFLSNHGHLYVKFNDSDKMYIANIKLKITDVIYCIKYGYFYLVNGLIYTGSYNVSDVYSYEARTLTFIESNLLKLNTVNNVLTISCSNNRVIFLTIDGNVYEYIAPLIVKLLYSNVKQIASCMYSICVLFYNQTGVLIDENEALSYYIYNVNKIASSIYRILVWKDIDNIIVGTGTITINNNYNYIIKNCNKEFYYAIDKNKCLYKRDNQFNLIKQPLINVINITFINHDYYAIILNN